MSQRIPGPGYSSSIPPIHAYQQQQHPPPSLPPPNQHHHASHAPAPPPPPPSHSMPSHQHHAPPPPHHHSQLPPYPPAQYQQPHPSQYSRSHPPPPPSRHDEPPPPSSEPSPNDQHDKPKYEPPAFSKIEEGTGLKYSTLDHGMFVLSVDLWDKDGIKEVNLVRSSTGPGAIASSNTYSYSTLEPGTPSYQQQALPPSRDAGYPQSQGIGYGQEYPQSVQQSYGQAPSYPSSSSYGPPQQYYPRHSGYNADPPAPPPGASFRNGYGQDQAALTRMAVVGGQPQGMFTRNLIGSLAASAFRLNDTEKKAGIWFVLQDLSVRTEGTFRLRFSFVNVGRPGGPGGLGANVNQGRAPILASCYSQDFSVYSAKKFPGVCESTPLSKTFALQGIKIPIRKDANIKGEGDDEIMYDQN
ncbi:hypothetical protein NW768_006136 [Fusarium equiseti]|uniref:Velvet domain-containing protein n=1 Tax=Fusarium equiseti TaxID=61235 RepID=A0ABQ8RDV7_FUSEQ|nr:hypothetical protein NW768_006136 [Fusarium equiseti]